MALYRHHATNLNEVSLRRRRRHRQKSVAKKLSFGLASKQPASHSLGAHLTFRCQVDVARCSSTERGRRADIIIIISEWGRVIAWQKSLCNQQQQQQRTKHFEQNCRCQRVGVASIDRFILNLIRVIWLFCTKKNKFMPLNNLLFMLENFTESKSSSADRLFAMN